MLISPNKMSDFIDLSHTISDGLITYPGLPAPLICDFLSREQSREHYAPGTEFQIGSIRMCSNTGTYLDSPFHRYAEGVDLSELPLERLAEIPAVTIDVTGSRDRAVEHHQLVPYDVRGRAVPIRTGWDRHWRTHASFASHPFLTAEAANLLVHAAPAARG